MEEVVAKRHTGIGVAGIGFIVLGIFMVAFGFVWLVKSNSIMVLTCICIIGLSIVGCGIWLTVTCFKLPKNIIVYREETLYFPDGFHCRPDEITHCKVTVNSYYGIANKWGKLTLTISGGTVSYRYVANIQKVADRLSDIKDKYMEKLISEKKTEEEFVVKTTSEKPLTDVPGNNNLDDPFDF